MSTGEAKRKARSVCGIKAEDDAGDSWRCVAPAGHTPIEIHNFRRVADKPKKRRAARERS